LEFRVTPSLTLSTLTGPRRAGDGADLSPTVAFRAGVNATWRGFIGLQNATPNGPNDISQENDPRNISGNADARLDVLPGRPVGGALFLTYSHVVQPNVTTIDPNLAFSSNNVGGGVDLAIQPGGGTLDWHFGYQGSAVLFDESNAQVFSNLTNE